MTNDTTTNDTAKPIGGFWLALSCGNWSRSHDRSNAIGRVLARSGDLSHLQLLRIPDSDDLWDIFNDGRVTWQEDRPHKRGDAWGEVDAETIDTRGEALDALEQMVSEAANLAHALGLDRMQGELDEIAYLAEELKVTHTDSA